MCSLPATELSLQLWEPLSSRLCDFYVRQEMTDVTINCPNGELTAHKLVLSLVSDYFKQQFTKTHQSDSNTFIFFDIAFEDIKTIVDIIYFGRQLVSKTRSQSLLRIAERLDIKLVDEDVRRHETTADTTTLRPAHQKSVSLSCQQFREMNVFHNRLIVNESENDISFDDLFSYENETPLNLSSNKFRKSLAATEIGMNCGKKRQRKQSDPKPSRKCLKLNQKSDSRAILESIGLKFLDLKPEEKPNNSVDDYLNDVMNNHDCEPTFNQSSKQFDKNKSLANTSNAQSYEKTIDFVVNSSNDCCVNSWSEKSIKSVKRESTNEVKECGVCGDVFSTEKQLISHLKKEHKKDEFHECHYCKTSFKFAKKFAVHAMSCSAKPNHSL